MEAVVGKSTKGVSPDRMIMNQRLEYQVKMGYADLENKDPFRSIRFIQDEHAFDHVLSIRNTGRKYQMARFKELIPIDIYLTYPIDIIEDLIAGMASGEEDRATFEAAQKEKEETERTLVQQESAKAFDEIRHPVK